MSTLLHPKQQQQQQQSNPSSSSPSSPPPLVPSKLIRLSTLLGATMETIIHELLYIRRVYPRDTFLRTRFLGVACHVNRHPGVVSYITDALNVAIPAILSGTNRVVDEVSLVIMDTAAAVMAVQGTNPNQQQQQQQGQEKEENRRKRRVQYEKVVERFTFQFSDVHGMTLDGPSSLSSSISSWNDNTNNNNNEPSSLHANIHHGPAAAAAAAAVVGDKDLIHKTQQLERGMRNLLLRVIAMEGSYERRGLGQSNNCATNSRRTKSLDGLTFKICLHVPAVAAAAASAAAASCSSSSRAREDDNDNDNDNNNNMETNHNVDNNNNVDEQTFQQKIAQCKELHEALALGAWYQPDAEACLFDDNNGGNETNRNRGTDDDLCGGLTRPLKSVSIPSCGLRMQLLMEVDCAGT